MMDKMQEMILAELRSLRDERSEQAVQIASLCGGLKAIEERLIKLESAKAWFVIALISGVLGGAGTAPLIKAIAGS